MQYIHLIIYGPTQFDLIHHNFKQNMSSFIDGYGHEYGIIMYTVYSI